MGMLSLSLLGHFRAERDGQPLAGIESAKGRALLTYLAVEIQRSHARSELAWLLWPDLPDSVALTNLRQTLANLRNALGDRTNAIPYLLIERDSIQLNAASDYQLDVVEFRLLLEACQQHRHRHLSRCTSCAQRFECAASLYQGEFLDHFPSVDSEPFEQWLEAQREPLQQQALYALERLMAYHEQSGEHEQALGYAQRQVAIAPWHESGHRKVMQLLAGLGQRNAALVHYHRMVEVLDEELGVEPDTESRQLYERLCQGEIKGLVTDNLPKHNLPTPSNRFIGREAVLAQIHALLEEPANRLVTVVGPGGIGKTRLALQAATEQRYAYQDGVYFVGLAPIRDPELVVSAIMQALGVKEEAGEPPLERVKQYLHDKEVLLLLDNFEQVVEAALVVAELLAAAPALQILVTSREALHLYGEQEFLVPPLTLPGPGRWGVEQMTQYEAVRLFIERARAIKGDFQVTNNNAPAVVEICVQVEGLPLAIELAAARVKTLSPPAILEHLHHRLHFLTRGPRDLPARQQTLRATIDWSYQLLTEQEQRLFARLAVFVGGWTLQAAEAVCNPSQELGSDVLDGLTALVDKSLVQQWETERGEQRFGMLETIREYALEHLAASEMSEQLKGRHASYYLTAAEELYELSGAGAADKAWAEEMDQELDNLRAALDWSTTSCDHIPIMVRMVAALWYFWSARGYHQEGYFWLARAAHALDADVAPRVRLRVLWGLLNMVDSRDVVASRRRLQEILQYAREVGDDGVVAWALCELAELDAAQGKHEAARVKLDESYAIAVRLSDEADVARVYDSRGYLAVSERDYVRAEHWYHSAWRSYKIAGKDRLAMLSSRALGWVLFGQGRYEEAEHHLDKTLSFFQARKEAVFSSLGLLLLGITMLEQGRVQQATALLREGLVGVRHLPASWPARVAFIGLAGAALATQQMTKAAQLLGVVDGLLSTETFYWNSIHQTLFEQYVAKAQVHLTRTSFATAWAEGRAMTLEEAIAYALEK